MGQLRLGSSERESMAFLYRKCIKAGITRGRERYAMSLAVARIVCGSAGIIRDFGALAGQFGIDSGLDEAYGTAVARMIERSSMPKAMWGCITDCMDMAAAGQEERKLAGSMLAEFLKQGIGKRDPKAVSGAIAYVAVRKSGKRLGQKEIPGALVNLCTICISSSASTDRYPDLRVYS